MGILLLTLALYLLYLIYERLTLNRVRAAIPTVVCVTGTRGKTSVVRLLASVLRENGQRALAKTTGSEAQYLLPDGSIEDVPRRNIVSILEQKRVMRKAVELNAEYLVVEMMSIHPHNHFVESHHLLRPDVVVVTNVRRDHIEAMGGTEEEIGRVLSLGIPPSATSYVPEAICRLISRSDGRSLEENGVSVLSGCSASLSAGDNSSPAAEFSGNLDLTAALCRDWKINESVIARGIRNAVHDIGHFKIWKYPSAGKTIFLVNAFAANDPDSTMRVLEMTRKILTGSPEFTGLLNLRADRGDRTEQWIQTLRTDWAQQFSRVYVMGGHKHVVGRKVRNAEALKRATPEKIIAEVVAQMNDGGVLFGFGNMGGDAKLLVDHWKRVGQAYGL